MPEPPRQLPLDLPVAPRHGAEDFLVGPSNEAAHALVMRWPDWPDSILRLVGPEGSGKTHLGLIWSERAGAAVISAAEITADRVRELVGLEAILIEDCDRGLGDEAALFHLLNALRGRKGHALVTARTPPEGWGLVTPDLLSRLRLAPAVEVEAPDDALLRAVMVKLFLDRQLVVDAGVIETVLLRMERSLAAAARIVAALDHEALSRGRRITRTMAAAVLENLTSADVPEDDEGG